MECLGTLYIASALSACNEIYPIAFAVVNANENTENWEWFLKNLLSCCPILCTGPPGRYDPVTVERRRETNDATSEANAFEEPLELYGEEDVEVKTEEILTQEGAPRLELLEDDADDERSMVPKQSPYDYFSFISDRQKGLVKALKTVFPNCHSSNCAVHIARNIQTKHGRDVAKEVLQLAKTFSQSEAESIIEGLPEKAREYVENIEENTWRNTAWLEDEELPPRYGIVTSNISEAANSMFSGARNGPWLHTVDEILSTIADRISVLRKGRADPSGIVPKVWEKMKKNWDQTAKYRVNQVEEGLSEYRVTVRHQEGDGHAMAEGKRFNIDVRRHYCDCGKWQSHKTPCVHALTYYKQAGKSLEWVAMEVTSDFHKYDCERALLKRNIRTVCINLLRRDKQTKPPYQPAVEEEEVEQKNPVGRPKKDARLRRRSDYDKETSPIVCKICQQRGHNSRTCARRKKEKEAMERRQPEIKVEDGFAVAFAGVEFTNESDGRPERTLRQSMSTMDLM